MVDYNGYSFSQDVSPIVERVKKVQQAGKKVVLTNGCFDLLHPGHVYVLEKARAEGDFLLVCLNTDDSVSALKPGRPICSLNERMTVIGALKSVDEVVPFADNETTADHLLQVFQPDIYVKGGDYTAETLPEAPTARDLGIDMKFIGEKICSTTDIIQRILLVENK